ncbi:Hypothetical_protein [Hexamita inflata]|uniref:Hypothetical_protein n=1 Tax=Hexamita inflata TaxID=28002 RepID=A0AA86Q8Q6_9EUKA|nr:Hypothetical protein HINF_LOCUS12349 [Hexamita inflata]CAI9951547.1 Hypothetical protein HINF_LOCUS39192 [Hexamita inflata]
MKPPFSHCIFLHRTDNNFYCYGNKTSYVLNSSLQIAKTVPNDFVFTSSAPLSEQFALGPEFGLGLSNGFVFKFKKHRIISLFKTSVNLHSIIHFQGTFYALGLDLWTVNEEGISKCSFFNIKGLPLRYYELQFQAPNYLINTKNGQINTIQQQGNQLEWTEVSPKLEVPLTLLAYQNEEYLIFNAYDQIVYLVELKGQYKVYTGMWRLKYEQSQFQERILNGETKWMEWLGIDLERRREQLEFSESIE